MVVPSLRLAQHPLVIFALSLVILWCAAWIARSVRKSDLTTEQQADYATIIGATLTLLALIIGFSFSMAASRYDQRKTLEEAEANAIGTELVRAELLPAEAAARTSALLKQYLGLRIAFYGETDDRRLATINRETSATQTKLWDAVRSPSLAKPTPVNALVLAGMNDVLNSQGYTQAAWWNRIPPAAWWLMVLIAISANALVGYSSHRVKGRPMALLILPLVASIAFLLIADLDSPRGGLIRVTPQNLLSLAASINGS